MASQNKRRVFVTGAGGFVGANLTRVLLKNNYSVHILNHSKNLSWRLQEISQNLHIHQGDITDFQSLKKIIQTAKPDYIIHLAAYGAYHFQTELDKIVDVNLKGTTNLLEASKDIPYKLFINTGSSSEYGINKKPMKENDFCKPTSYYAATKLGATQLCKVFAQSNDKPIVTFRLFSVYGPYEAPTRLIPVVAKAIIKNTNINLSPGNQRRDFIYIDDVCDAYLRALKLGDKLTGEICNVGTGNEYTNSEIVKTFFKVANKKTTINKGAYPKRNWDTPHWKADISHVKKVLGWKPASTIDKGLASTYSWFEDNLALYQ